MRKTLFLLAIGCFLSFNLYAESKFLEENPIDLGSGSLAPNQTVNISFLPIANQYPYSVTCLLDNPNENPEINWIPMQFNLRNSYWGSYDFTLNDKPLYQYQSGSLTLSQNVLLNKIIIAGEETSLTMINLTNTDAVVQYTCEARAVEVEK